MKNIIKITFFSFLALVTQVTFAQEKTINIAKNAFQNANVAHYRNICIAK